MSNDENNFRDDKFEDALKNEIFKDDNLLNDDLNEGKGFILCNDFGIDVEVEKVKLLEAPKSEFDVDDEYEARLLIEQVKNQKEIERKEREKNSVIFIISCMIIVILMFFGFGYKHDFNKDIYNVSHASYKYNGYSCLEIEYVKRLILSDLTYSSTPNELINAYQYLNQIGASIGGRNNVYDLLIAFGESIYNSDFTLSDKEYTNLVRVFDSLINEFVESNQLNNRQIKKVVNTLDIAFASSRGLGRILTFL